jgi:beta-glucosidase
MQKYNSQLPLLIVTAAIIGVGTASAQETNRPWMDSPLSLGERSELVLKQLTLDERLALVHGKGMAGESQWRMPLTPLTNGGAGYTQGVERLGIPPLISHAGRYSTAMPSNLGATSSWDPESACQFGEMTGGELRAQGFDVTLGGA